MKIFAVLALCVLAVSAEKTFTTLRDLSSKGIDTRIINGELATTGQFPWQVAVHQMVGGYWYVCGGTLISPKWVLTAGQCADGVDYFYMYFGTTHLTGGIYTYSYDAYIHPGYTEGLTDDIALILLPEPIELTDTIQPIALVPAGNVIGVGDTVTVSGWGKVNNSFPGVTTELRYVDLTTISNEECHQIYGDVVQSNTFCCEAGWPIHSTCNGDSGSPVIQYFDNKPFLVGSVSFIHSYGCESGYPSGYIRIESMLDWIYSTTGLSPIV